MTRHQINATFLLFYHRNTPYNRTPFGMFLFTLSRSLNLIRHLIATNMKSEFEISRVCVVLSLLYLN